MGSFFFRDIFQAYNGRYQSINILKGDTIMATMISVIGTRGKWDVYSALVMPFGGSLLYASTLAKDFEDLSEAIDFSKKHIEKKIEEDKDQDKPRDYIMMIADSDLIGNDDDPDSHITHTMVNNNRITVQIVPWTMEVEL